MKSIITIAALSVLSAPAFAGPYANVENNAGWVGNDFEGAVTEVHAGYEFEASENVSLYVQAGPAFISIEDEDLRLKCLVSLVLLPMSQNHLNSTEKLHSSQKTKSLTWIPSHWVPRLVLPTASDR